MGVLARFWRDFPAFCKSCIRGNDSAKPRFTMTLSAGGVTTINNLRLVVTDNKPLCFYCPTRNVIVNDMILTVGDDAPSDLTDVFVAFVVPDDKTGNRCAPQVAMNRHYALYPWRKGELATPMHRCARVMTESQWNELAKTF